MADNDYPKIVCKILVYLYRRLKKTPGTPDFSYLQPNTDEFPIDVEYFNYILSHMKEDGLIENIVVMKTWGNDVIIRYGEKLQITPQGIEYLSENSTMKKLARVVPLGAAIAELFI